MAVFAKMNIITNSKNGITPISSLILFVVYCKAAFLRQNGVTMEKQATNTKYFAAANGYLGFRSYFYDIFNPRKYERIYVLKGGPGTGKSSLMKRLASDLALCECSIEEIYCSSDPASLDGIIAIKNDKRIAMIDGTAPHETDAVLPGACDEIINLGDAWDARWLIGERERILKTNEEKKNAYRCAYSSLSIAGKANDAVNNFKAQLYNEENSKKLIKSLADKLSSAKSGDATTRLITAFCKRGFVHLDTLENISETIFTVSGDTYASHRFLSELCTHLNWFRTELLRCPSPLDDGLTEAIFIPSIKTCFKLGEGQNNINTELFYTDDLLSCERRKCAEECHTIALQDSERWFAIASELHFTLEDIYTRAMNFDIIDNVYSSKLYEIKELLCCL